LQDILEELSGGEVGGEAAVVIAAVLDTEDDDEGHLLA